MNSPNIIVPPEVAKVNEERKFREAMELSEKEEQKALQDFQSFCNEHNVVIDFIKIESSMRGVIEQNINFVSKRRLKTQ